jgi:hypothetical protein
MTTDASELILADDLQRLLDSFDLTALPHLVALDASGVVQRKYFSLK